MSNRHFLHAGLLSALLLLTLSPAARAGDVVVLTYSGPIGPISAEYIARGISEGEARGAAAVVIELDTPGGLDSSMRQIIQREMNARVPVVLYVAPRGARATSAGCLIVLASDVAAMAPGTNIGAAHPIDLSGGPVSQKILNDAIAYARSLAAARHRNEAWAEQAVRESVSLPADEAVKQGVVDFLADDLNDLLGKLNGRTVRTGAGEIRLSLAGAQTVAVGINWREEVLVTLTNPTVAYLLLLLGLLGIIVEVIAPHGFVTGTFGGIAFMLALVGLANLPVQLSGAALLILGVVLLLLELKITTHGLLTLAGLVAFVLGSLLLLPHVPGYDISRWAIGTVTLAWVGILGAVVRLVVKARHKPLLTGVERVVGQTGVAKTELAPRGVVLVGGEDWNAEADPAPVARGEKVQVLGVKELTLRVRKVS